MSIPRNAIADLFRTLSRLQVGWDTDANPQFGMQADGRQAWCLLSLTSYEQMGDDDYRQWDSEANPDVLASAITGYRKFTTAVRAVSFDANLQPYDILERIRWGLRTVTAANFYAANGVAFVACHPIRILRGGTDVESRVRLEASMDVVLSRRAASDILTDDDGITIGSVDPPTGTLLP